MKKGLYRSRTQRMIGGVCGGIAEYFDIDPTLVRLLFMLSIVAGGAGMILYILALIVMPEAPYDDSPDEYDTTDAGQEGYDNRNISRNRGIAIIGVVLIIIGLLSLVKRIIPGIWYYVKHLSWPIAFIVIGIAIIFISLKKR